MKFGDLWDRKLFYFAQTGINLKSKMKQEVARVIARTTSLEEKSIDQSEPVISAHQQ